ncbi:M81 family metallopeptidase [Oceanibaculum nanhaiense]|jgi:microcystin degradation protein MlrC|uniref:M81 family metallopeptidase n=1 Tax=Oceanibaculum nanhaiense TaxID=1909734 RepID=UPI000A3AA017|nr:M81 family metallopeptidase [Oceanibaculum nanhaiense]MBC7136914.1 M81 family metallopeptidase [Oceanibaculum nanhaiense]
MARIAIGGFQHETNTFAPSKATFEDFARGGSWPALVSGGDLFDAVKGINLSIAGFIEEAQERGHELVPTAWGAASPSAHVTEDAYERIAGMIVDGIRDKGPFEAVYLCLHGAMVTEHLEDGEGELLRRVRELVGPKVPVMASLDLHSNTTPEMIKYAEALVAYRTYPHVDMADTGRRTAIHLDNLLRGSGAVNKAFRQIPFLIPLNFQCTLMEPTKSIYEMTEELEKGDVARVSFTPGFPAADIHHCGPSLMVYATDQVKADKAAKALEEEILRNEAKFAGKLYEPDEGVKYAMKIARSANKPVVIADTQDNPGAGGDSNTTGMLRALVENDAPNAAIGIMVDEEVARIAHSAGEGAEITVALGGKSNIPGDKPFHATFKVVKLNTGVFTGTGPFYKGARMNLGPMACLKIRDVEIVVACKKAQMADQEMYRHVGIEPTRKGILVNKSSVHFRADFQPIAQEVLVCTAPGPMVADPALLPWTRLRKGIKLRPLGPVFEG